jgi:hypothetical protein
MAEQRFLEFCPRCGRRLSGGFSFVQEYWCADETVLYCWCAACSWAGEIKAVIRTVGIEPVEVVGDAP